jgi:1-acyl-sn-glycerol-3-phosphate acyltransferase
VRGRSGREIPLSADAPDDLLEHALDDLGREIRARFEEHAPAAVDPFALLDDLRALTQRFGMRERTEETDDFGMDPERVRRVQPLLELLRSRWWRVEVNGLERVPEGPVLFVANRSGLLPYDGLMVAHVVAKARGERARPRFLVADWLITLPFAQPWLTRLGAVRASFDNAERLLHSGRSVVAFPEGLKGAGKPFRDRYRLQRFGRGGVVRLALETGVPLVPVAIVGAEEAHPVLFKVGALARTRGAAFLPVTPTFPWLGPAGLVPLPSKWSIRFGEPLDGLEARGAADELLVARVNEELRARLQAMLDADLHARPGVFG